MAVCMTTAYNSTEPNQRRSNAVTVRFPAEMLEQVRSAAREDYTTTSSIVVRATSAFLKARTSSEVHGVSV